MAKRSWRNPFKNKKKTAVDKGHLSPFGFAFSRMVKTRERLSIDRGDHRAKWSRLQKEKAQKKHDAFVRELSHPKVLPPKTHRLRRCPLVIAKPEVKKEVPKVVAPWLDVGSPQSWDRKAVQASEHLVEKRSEQRPDVLQSRGFLSHVLFMETFYELVRYKPLRPRSRGTPLVAEAWNEMISTGQIVVKSQEPVKECRSLSRRWKKLTVVDVDSDSNQREEFEVPWQHEALFQSVLLRYSTRSWVRLSRRWARNTLCVGQDETPLVRLLAED